MAIIVTRQSLSASNRYYIHALFNSFCSHFFQKVDFVTAWFMYQPLSEEAKRWFNCCSVKIYADFLNTILTRQKGQMPALPVAKMRLNGDEHFNGATVCNVTVKVQCWQSLLSFPACHSCTYCHSIRNPDVLPSRISVITANVKHTFLTKLPIRKYVRANWGWRSLICSCCQCLADSHCLTYTSCVYSNCFIRTQRRRRQVLNGMVCLPAAAWLVARRCPDFATLTTRFYLSTCRQPRLGALSAAAGFVRRHTAHETAF